MRVNRCACHSYDQSTQPAEIHLDPQSTRPKWALTMVSFLVYTTHEGKSTLNATINCSLLPLRRLFYLSDHSDCLAVATIAALSHPSNGIEMPPANGGGSS